MKNGQLKPGYNVNVATVSEYIIGNYISADRTDTKTFIPFLNKLCNIHPVQRVVVDSGYESEENYRYVDGSEQLSLFVKPSNHEQKKKRKYKNDIGRRETMAYDAEKDLHRRRDPAPGKSFHPGRRCVRYDQGRYELPSLSDQRKGQRYGGMVSCEHGL